MKLYLISFLALLPLFGSHSTATAETQLFNCTTTDAFAISVTDLNDVPVTGPLSIQTSYKLKVDMNNLLAPCGTNPAYQVSNSWGVTIGPATDSSCGDATFWFTTGGVAPKGTMSWGVELTPIGVDQVAGGLCWNYSHSQTITGTAN